MTKLNLLAGKVQKAGITQQALISREKRSRLSLIILLVLLLLVFALILFGKRLGITTISSDLFSQVLTTQGAEAKTLSEYPQIYVSKVSQSIHGNTPFAKGKPDPKTSGKEWELILKIEREKGACLNLLSSLKQNLPPFVWIVSIIVASEGDYFIQGITFSPTRAMEFVKSLEQTSHVRDVQLPSVTRGHFGASEAFLFTVLGTIQGPFERTFFSRRPVLFSKETHIDSFLGSLNKVGEKYGLTLTETGVDSLMPERKRIKNEELYVEGSYQQLISFLDYLMHCPEAVSVSRLVVLSAPAQDLRYDQINASLLLNFYR